MPESVTIKAHAGYLKRALTTNSTTATAYAAHLPTLTEPATTATVFVGGNGAGGPSATTLRVIPFAIGSNDQTANVLVLKWNKTSPGATGLWVPTIVADVQYTISSTLVGKADSDVIATELFSDGFTLTKGSAVFSSATSNADIMDFICDISNAQRWSVQFYVGTATSANALVQES